jgi:hypothetical protein
MSDLGSFITTPPSGTSLNETSIFTSALKFSSSSFPTTPTPTEDESGGDESVQPSSPASEPTDIESGAVEDLDEIADAQDEAAAEEEGSTEDAGAVSAALGDAWDGITRAESRRQVDEGDVTNEIDETGGFAGGDGDVEAGEGDEETPDTSAPVPTRPMGSIGSGGSTAVIPVYSSPIEYSVAKTGYYCVGMSSFLVPDHRLIRLGIVPVTLVNSRSDIPEDRDNTHAEYSGMVLFRNTFDGELPAVEYPKVNVGGLHRPAYRD